MEKHPLLYFIDLIELKQVEKLKESFLFVDPYSEVSYINEQEEYIDKWVLNKMGNAEEKVRVTFTEFLNEFLPKKRSEILTNIDLHLLHNLDEKGRGTFISLIIKNIDDLLFQIPQYPDAAKYPVISNTLNELKVSLQRKYSVNGTSTPTPIAASNAAQPKLKWNAGVASLCTMFYELANDYKMEKQGINFLSASPDQLKKFILANFVDEEGNNLSDASVATYLDSSRTDKKAKRNRVEIDKIIPGTNGGK